MKSYSSSLIKCVFISGLRIRVDGVDPDSNFKKNVIPNPKNTRILPNPDPLSWIIWHSSTLNKCIRNKADIFAIKPEDVTSIH